MSSIEPFDPDERMHFEVNLDIPAFVRAAVRRKMNRETILMYLALVANTPVATEQMRQFGPVAVEQALTRTEILVWLHVSYGGSMEPRRVSRKLRIPPRFAEQALAALAEKGIITERR